MDLMNIRRNMIAAQSELPFGYKEIEYISATGTQYIATNYVPKIGDQITTKFLMAYSSGMQSLFSAGNNNYQLIFLEYPDQGISAYYKYFTTGNATELQWHLPYNTWHDIIVDSTGYITSGEKSGTLTPAQELDGNYTNLWLLKRRNGNYGANGSISRFTITHEGKKTLNLIPCIRKIDNEIGMYDTISKQFYGNAGTDVFIAGPEIVNNVILPISYTKLNYIKGSGAYIDTDLILQRGYVISITFETETNSSQQAVWGYRYNGTWSDITQANIYYNAGNRVIALGKGLTVQQHGNNNAYQFDTINQLIIDTAKNRVLLNGTQPEINFDFSNGAMFNSSGSSVYSPYIFASNRMGTYGLTSTNTKIYDYKVSFSGITLTHLIPCIDPNGTYGMYDTIRKRFFESAQSNTTFTGG